ncbi:histidine kinase [Rufibacter immobilis]|uniref:Histidine kinase n=1 Tax=Rufibacter immobilis TaxID=1348778 RepID=A0A3M9MQT1_9BACT|nr:histidine kinase [Rufibacter immobilis]RNI27861.1 histidine kinase [Rufibacter immobilis]
MKKRLPLLLHLLLWIVLLVFNSFYSNARVSTIPLTWKVADLAQTFLFHIALFYFNWLVLVPKILAKNKVLLYAVAVILTLALFVVIRTPIEIFEMKKSAQLDPAMAEQIRKYPSIYSLKGVMVPIAIMGVLNIFLSSSLKVTGDYLRNERRRRELELRQATTELELLKAQVNPHFLFNTLNNIYSLAYQNSPSTPDAILKLSLLLRYQLYETDVPLVPLEKEIEHLQHLLDLHRLRLPNPGLLTLQIDGDTSRFQLPPMLLMPLVENLFKHGLTTAPMQLHLLVEDDHLTFITHNTVKPTPTQEAYGGIGLQNLRRRLELLFPNAYTLETHSQGPEFDARLELRKLT